MRALDLMTEGNQLWVERHVPDGAPADSYDSLTDCLRNMKSSETQHLRFVFDPETNLMEMIDTRTGAKSTHVVTNLTAAARKAIMDSGLNRPSMAARVITTKEEMIEAYGQPREVTQEEANRAFEALNPPTLLGVVRVREDK